MMCVSGRCPVSRRALRRPFLLRKASTALAPRLDALADTEQTASSKAIIVTAIGHIADIRKQAWNNAISVDRNYHASLPTLDLLGGAQGVL